MLNTHVEDYVTINCVSRTCIAISGLPYPKHSDQLATSLLSEESEFFKLLAGAQDDVGRVMCRKPLIVVCRNTLIAMCRLTSMGCSNVPPNKDNILKHLCWNFPKAALSALPYFEQRTMATQTCGSQMLSGRSMHRKVNLGQNRHGRSVCPYRCWIWRGTA